MKFTSCEGLVVLFTPALFVLVIWGGVVFCKHCKDKFIKWFIRSLSRIEGGSIILEMWGVKEEKKNETDNKN